LPESRSRLAAGGIAIWGIAAAMVLFRNKGEKIDLRPGVPCTQAIDKCELPNYPDLRGLRP
jgi:hypothetical protein